MTQKAGSAGFSVCFVFCFFFYLPPLNHMFLHEFSIWQSLSFFPWHRPKAGVLISKCGMLTVASYKSFPVYRYNYLLCVLLPPSDAYVRSFLYLLYTLIKPYYTKALSDQASSLAPDWILLLQGPRIPVSSCDSTTTFHSHNSNLQIMIYFLALGFVFCIILNSMVRIFLDVCILLLCSFIFCPGFTW